MPDRERKRGKRRGASTQPVDEGIEGAIFEENDSGRKDPESDVRELDAAARGESRIASRSGENQSSGGAEPTSDTNSGEESPPPTRP